MPIKQDKKRAFKALFILALGILLGQVDPTIVGNLLQSV